MLGPTTEANWLHHFIYAASKLPTARIQCSPGVTVSDLVRKVAPVPWFAWSLSTLSFIFGSRVGRYQHDIRSPLRLLHYEVVSPFVGLLKLRYHSSENLLAVPMSHLKSLQVQQRLWSSISGMHDGETNVLALRVYLRPLIGTNCDTSAWHPGRQLRSIRPRGCTGSVNFKNLYLHL